MGFQRFNIRLTKDMHAWFQAESKRLGVPMAALMITIMQYHIDQKELLAKVDIMKELAKTMEQAGV